MQLSTIALLAVAGAISGAVNAVAGGGTFLTFGALSLVGVPPISANATSSITQFPGYVTSTLAYWSDILKIWRVALVLCVISAIGALAGALLLLTLDNPSFRRLVPWLLLGATALFAVGPLLRPVGGRSREVRGAAKIGATAAQLATALYGGFFGAGMGVMMLATLGFTEKGDYHHLNALKNLLSIVIAGVAIIVFASGGVVSWPEAIVMIPAVALGGYFGVWVAHRLPTVALRAFVIAAGVLLATYYFVAT